MLADTGVRPRTAGRFGGLSPSGGFSLVAVVAVLVVVAVPRLKSLALLENEGDARVTAQWLARALAELDARGGRPASVGDCMDRPPLASLSDCELLAGGTLLRRHGYLFESARVPGPGDAATVRVCAWPWAHGRTGRGVYVVDAEGTIWEHADEQPLWEGPLASPVGMLDPAAWRKR